MSTPSKTPQKNYLLVTLLGSFWNVIQLVTSFAIAIIVSILLTRHFHAYTYGLYAYLNWFSSVMLLILNFGIVATVQTWIPKYYFTDQLPRAAFIARKLFRTQGLILLVGLVGMIPLLLVWHNFVTFPSGLFTTLMLVNLLPMLMNIMNVFLSTLLVSLQRFKRAVLIYITGQFLILAAAILVVNINLQLLGLLLLMGIISFITMILFLYACRDVLRKTSSTWTDDSEAKKLIGFSGWAYLSTFLQTIIWDKSEFFFLGKFRTGNAVAIYGIAYTLANMVTTVFEPVISVFTTVLSELVAKNDWDRIRLIIRLCSKYVSLLLLPLVSLAYALSHYVIRFVYGQEFLLVASIFPVLLFSTTLNRIFAPAWAIPQYMHDLKRFVSRIAIFAPLNIALDIILIPKFGVWGATLANVITQVSALSYFGFFVRRYHLRLFTMDFLKIIFLNAILFGLIFVTIKQQGSFTRSFIVCVTGILLYGLIVIKKFITPEDRQLITNSIQAVRNRAVA